MINQPELRRGRIRETAVPSAAYPVATSIVPQGGVRGQALVVVVAIMTFLAALALGGVNLVRFSAQNWQNEISSEATVQIRPVDGVDMEKALADAVKVVKSFREVQDARIMSLAETRQLLEPWFGSSFEIDELPVPRLVIVTLQTDMMPDFASIRAALQQKVPGAGFDDHRIWVGRLVSMAYASVAVGVGIFILVLTAMILTVVFATRSALSDNHYIVEVLHFIGADTGFVARQFDRYFFRTGLKGALLGGGCAIFVFFLVSNWLSFNATTPEGSQLAVFFGRFSTGWVSLAEIFVLIIFVSGLAMFTSRYTVIRNLREIDRKGADFFGRTS